MKAIICLFAVIAFLAIQINGQLPTLFPPQLGDKCKKYDCVKPLKECGVFNRTLGDPSTAINIGCRGEAECVSTQTNIGTDRRGICISPVALGSPCGTGPNDNKCESGTTCSNNFCALRQPNTGFKYPGESCKHDLDCQYTRYATGDDTIRLCNGGHCKKINNGEYCNTQYTQCQYGKSYCGVDSRCTKNIKKGGLCNFGDATQYGCGRTSMCVPTSSSGQAGTCQPFYSLSEGAYCDNSRENNNCKEGLFCGSPRAGEEFGVCTKPINTLTLNQRCPNKNSIYSGCNNTNHEQCACSDKTDYETCIISLPPKGYGKASDSYNECIRKNCANRQENKCIYDHCKNQACKIYEMGRKVGGGVNCQAYSYCNSAFILSFSPFLVLSAFIAVFLF